MISGTLRILAKVAAAALPEIGAIAYSTDPGRRKIAIVVLVKARGG
jgi:hypothetical protein